LPGWRKLLANLAAKISQEPGLAERLEKLDLRDQASLLQRRFERYELTADGLGPAIAEELAGHQPSLVHQLLASLPVREMVTTNFDELLERAVAAVDGTTPAILPFDAATSSDRWILKLHGTVDRPETIVLTRDDYLRTSVTHGALLGLVQALLVTRHMLFVGYSLSDEDFHQLVHEIRSALPGRDPMGTALLLEPDDLLADLWAADLNLVPMEPPSTGIESPARASGVRSRRVQILLDLVGYLAADLSHFVLDETYAALLDEDEKDLRDQLNSLAGLLGRSDASITEPLRQTLERYGLAEK
jgi:hypothetical protein